MGRTTRRSLLLGMLLGIMVGAFVGTAYAVFTYAGADVPAAARMEVERADPAGASVVALQPMHTQTEAPLLGMVLNAATAHGRTSMATTPGQWAHARAHLDEAAEDSDQPFEGYVSWRGDTFRVTFSG